MKSIILHSHEVNTLSETGIVTVVRTVANLCTNVPGVEYTFHETKDGMWELGFGFQDGTGTFLRYIKCPFSQPGDVRWVRETWVWGIHGADCLYKADKQDEIFKFTGKWRSSSTMPQWASRFNVECTSVKVEQIDGVWSWITAHKKVG